MRSSRRLVPDDQCPCKRDIRELVLPPGSQPYARQSGVTGTWPSWPPAPTSDLRPPTPSTVRNTLLLFKPPGPRQLELARAAGTHLEAALKGDTFTGKDRL